MHVCRCLSQGCKQQFYKDESGKYRSGKLVTRNQLRAHKLQDRVGELRAKQDADVVESLRQSTERDESERLQREAHATHKPQKSEEDGGQGVITDKDPNDLDNEYLQISDHLCAIRFELSEYTNKPFDRRTLQYSSSAKTPVLLYSEPGNRHILAYRDFLEKQKNFLQHSTTGGHADLEMISKTMLRTVEKELVRLEAVIDTEWKQRSDNGTALSHNLLARNYVDTAKHFTHPMRQEHSPLLSAHVLVAAHHLLCHQSERNSEYLAQWIKQLTDQDILKALPKSHQTIISNLQLEPDYQEYISCSKCHCLYPTLDIPEECTFRSTASSEVCGGQLRQLRHAKGQLKESYPRKYLHHDLRNWIGELLCRPGMEELLDRDVFAGGSTEMKKDIWDGDVLRDFKGPDGSPFIVPPKARNTPEEGRYLFSFCWDGFNPLGSRESGKKNSSCALYLVCLNLPITHRYLQENIFLVGVIPGPNEPSKEEINHYLTLLADDLSDFWIPGVFYSATASYCYGRNVLIAVVIVIADLPALRQAQGYAAHSSTHLCLFCLQLKDDIDNVHLDKWVLRKDEMHLDCSFQWKDATSEKDRDNLFDKHGVRWSAFNRLPYWKPVTFAGIDSMHLFYLGLLKWHNRELWGFDDKAHDGDGRKEPVTPGSEPARKDLENAFSIVAASEFKTVERKNREVDLNMLKIKKLHKFTVPVLYHLCKLICCLPEERYWNKKKHLLKCLEERIKSNSYPSTLPPSVPQGSTDVEDALGSSSVSTGQVAMTEDVNKARIALERGNKMQRFKKDTLIQLYLARCKDNFTADSLRKRSKVDLIGLLTKQQADFQVVGSSRMEGAGQRTAKKYKNTEAIGSATLTAIREDMQPGRQERPTWLTIVPKGLGSSKTGKLTADQWHTVSFVHLVVTLVRQWGDDPVESRYYKMLSNYMTGLAAIKLGTKRVISGSTVEQYTQYMKSYLSGILELYPHVQLTPNQHIALHFGDHLKRFGPTYASRTYVFERQNLLLQRIKTNTKPGEMERTLFRKYCMAQKLIAEVNYSHPKSVLRNLIPTIKALGSGKRVGTLAADMPEANPKKKSDAPRKEIDHSEVFSLLRMWCRERQFHPPSDDVQIQWLPQVSVQGIVYRRKDDLPRDCHIVIGDITNGQWCAADIIDIFHFVSDTVDGDGRHEERTFLVLREYEELNARHTAIDQYRKFPIVGGKVFYNRFKRHRTLLSVDEPFAHFVKTAQVYESRISEPHFHACPLDKVK